MYKHKIGSQMWPVGEGGWLDKVIRRRGGGGGEGETIRIFSWSPKIMKDNKLVYGTNFF